MANTETNALPEQGGFNERLDEILAAVYLAGTENGLGRRITDPEEITHRREAFIKANPANKEATNYIRTLVLEEIIEEDEIYDWSHIISVSEARNELRAEQRLRLGGTHGTK